MVEKDALECLQVFSVKHRYKELEGVFSRDKDGEFRNIESWIVNFYILGQQHGVRRGTEGDNPDRSLKSWMRAPKESTMSIKSTVIPSLILRSCLMNQSSGLMI